jgi:superfamily II DNA or RNA helicase
LSALLETTRQAALPGIWSQGVKLARAELVTLESRGSDPVLHVRTPDRPAPAIVTLYPADVEWTCDCKARFDPCAHVVAAVIAWTQSQQTGKTLARAAETGDVVGYRFKRQSGSLTFERHLVAPDGSERVIKGSLASLLAQERPGGALRAIEEDLQVDRIVAGWQPVFLAPERTGEIFRLLAAASDVSLDGQPIKTSGELVLPQAVVEDDPGGGVILSISPDARIDELVYFGVARCGDTLHVLGETGMTGMRLERLPITRNFAREQVGVLMQEVLPELRKRISVVIRTEQLPQTKRGDAPRIAMACSQHEHTLSVLPTLVYGDPPGARIDQGTLYHLSGPLPVRDLAAEKNLILQLRAALNLVPGRRVDFDGAEAIRFAERLRHWEAKSASASGSGIPHAGPLIPRLTVEDDRFELVFETPEPSAPGERRTASADAVVRSWRDGLGLVPLEGGGWAALPGDWLARSGQVVMDLLASRREDGSVTPALLPALGELCQALDQPPPPGLGRLRPLLQDFSGIPEAALPKGLRATLRPYQKRGVDWLSFLRAAGLGAILADDMGLGKTLETLCAVGGRTLIVCPKSVVHNWSSEIERFLPELTVSVYHGPKRELDPKAAITLTTYALLRLDAERLAAERWDTVVLDEAQAIKNPDSQGARAAYALSAGFRVALSGTPVENRLEELWSLMHFCNPGVLGGRTDFRERYEGPVSGGDRAALERLRARVRPFLLRRLKSEVLPELPIRSEVVLYCEFDESERAVYQAILLANQSAVIAKLRAGGSLLGAFELLLRLRQAACHPALVPGQTAETSAKLERLLVALETAAADGHKALVFSQWTSLLDLVEGPLGRAGIPFLRLDGRTRDRAGVVGEFQSPSGPPVMLVSLKAGGTGLNLTQADHVFLLDPWWNPMVEDQAADRAHRIGQTRPVMVYRMVAKDTVDEGILRLQHHKRAIAEMALDDADQAGGLAREDLLGLLA